ncbi:MAG TPA: NAD(P)-dependent oxidoreductase [Gaiellaceae bacterium]|jgi:siroheme synthase-like protein
MSGGRSACREVSAAATDLADAAPKRLPGQQSRPLPATPAAELGRGLAGETGRFPRAEKRYYHACLDLEGRRCLVVGGGAVGLEKAKGLLECGAVVTVVAPEVEPELARLPVRRLDKRYEPADLEGSFLVVAATPDRSVNRRIFLDAEARSMFANVVDTPDLCSFILPAVYRRDPIALAVSTGGASPALAKRLRDELGARIGDEHVALARRLRELRPWARRRYATYAERRDYFEALVEESMP